MTELTYLHGDYTGLSFDEVRFIQEYLLVKDNALLANYVRDHPLSDGFRVFLNDVLLGKYKRGKGESVQDRTKRDWLIYCCTKAIMQDTKTTLPDAAALAGEAFKVFSRDTSLQAYYRGELQLIRHEVHKGISRLMFEQGLEIEEAAKQIAQTLNSRETERNGRGKRKTYNKSDIIRIFHDEELSSGGNRNFN